MEIHIAYWTNENYTRYALVSLFSLLKNLKWKHTVICHLLTTPNNKYLSLFEDLKKSFKFFEFERHIIDEKDFDIPTSLPHLTSSSFYRLKVDSFVKWIEKILYIDADTIVLWDISELYNEDLNDNYVWVVSEWSSEWIKEEIKQFGLKHNKYFNAWVLLINLKRWKDFKVWDKALELLKLRRYPSDDQSPLNIILQDNCKWLDWKYNVTTTYFVDKRDFVNVWFDYNYYKSAINNPTIVHFTTAAKPRNFFCIHPYTLEYDKYLRWVNKLWFYKLSFKEKCCIIFHKIIFTVFPKYSTRTKISNFIHKYL